MRKCPYCGMDHSSLDSIDGNKFILCMSCGARGPQTDTTKEAKDTWNDQALPKMIRERMIECFEATKYGGMLEQVSTIQAEELQSIIEEWEEG